MLLDPPTPSVDPEPDNSHEWTLQQYSSANMFDLMVVLNFLHCIPYQPNPSIITLISHISITAGVFTHCVV